MQVPQVGDEPPGHASRAGSLAFHDGVRVRSQRSLTWKKMRARAMSSPVRPTSGWPGSDQVAAAPLAGRYDQTVTGGAVIGRILQRSGVTASELARRLGVRDGQVIAWAQGDPPLSVVDSIARACSLDLAKILAEPEPDPHDIGLLETTLAMTVDQRLERLKAYVRFVQAGPAALRNVA
jgi:transcriptional regulator with XRE-family HTH domain